MHTPSSERSTAHGLRKPVHYALTALTFLFAGNTLAIEDLDNGIFGDGHWRVRAGQLGDANTLDIDPAGPIPLTDLLSELSTYYDVGADGSALLLSSTSIGGTTFEAATNCALSTGQMTGQNGNVTWNARACLPFSQTRYNVTWQFDAQQPFGNVRIISLLNSYILNDNRNDSLGVFGLAGTPAFRILSVDRVESVGFTRGIGPLSNAAFIGWAAADSGSLAGRIQAPTPVLYTPSGNVNTTQIPQYNDPRYPSVRMYSDPANSNAPGYALAFDLAPTATSATIRFFVDGAIQPSDTIFESGFESL